MYALLCMCVTLCASVYVCIVIDYVCFYRYRQVNGNIYDTTRPIVARQLLYPLFQLLASCQLISCDNRCHTLPQPPNNLGDKRAASLIHVVSWTVELYKYLKLPNR